MATAKKPAEGDHTRRGRRRSTRSHEAVLTATSSVLGDVGYAALAMEAVAAAAGVGKATIYRWCEPAGRVRLDLVDVTCPRRSRATMPLSLR